MAVPGYLSPSNCYKESNGCAVGFDWRGVGEMAGCRALGRIKLRLNASYGRLRRSSDVRVQLPLTAGGMRALRTSSKNTDGHSRAKSPLAAPAARKAICALTLISFSSARRRFSLARSISSAFRSEERRVGKELR